MILMILMIRKGQTILPARKIPVWSLLADTADTTRRVSLVNNVSIVHDEQKTPLSINTQRAAENHTYAGDAREFARRSRLIGRRHHGNTRRRLHRRVWRHIWRICDDWWRLLHTAGRRVSGKHWNHRRLIQPEGIGQFVLNARGNRGIHWRRGHRWQRVNNHGRGAGGHATGGRGDNRRRDDLVPRVPIVKLVA